MHGEQVPVSNKETRLAPIVLVLVLVSLSLFERRQQNPGYPTCSRNPEDEHDNEHEDEWRN
jgi:hypothetical protein